MSLGDMIRAMGEAGFAAGKEAVKLTLREREAAARKRTLEIAREIARLQRLLAKIQGELDRHDYDDALESCDAEAATWMEDEGWEDSPEIVSIRVEIEGMIEHLSPGEDEDEDEDEEADDDWDDAWNEDGEVPEEEN